MDNETKEFLENMMSQINLKFESVSNELQEFREETSSHFANIDNRLSNLEDGQNEIKGLVEELDPKNATRHLEIKNSVDELRKDLAAVEVVTANNYAYIAKLKNVK